MILARGQSSYGRGSVILFPPTRASSNLERSSMHRPLFGSIVFALALAGGHHVTVAARPIFVVCGITNEPDRWIFVDNFEGVGGAVQQCVHHWKGFPKGVIN